MENKYVYYQYGKIYLSYEYWFLGFKRKGKRVLAALDYLGSDDLFAEYPKGFKLAVDSLVDYYKGLYERSEFEEQRDDG